MCPPTTAPPQWHGVPPPLGFCEYNELSFQWQLSPGLLASLYLNNNKTYILKQTPPVASITQEQNPGFFPQLRRPSKIWALPAFKTLSPAPPPQTLCSRPSKAISTLGPFTWLSPLPGPFFPQSSSWVAPYRHAGLSFHATSSGRPFLSTHHQGIVIATSWVFPMCQAPFYVLFMYSLFESSQQPYTVGIIIISILQVRKLKLREFRDMTKVSQLTGRRAGIQIQQPFPKPIL